MKKFILFFIAIFFLVGVRAGQSKIVLETIKAHYATGQLSYEQYLVYSALSILDPDQLPQTYHVVEAEPLPIKSGTYIIQEVKSNWDKLSPHNQALLQSYFARPSLPFSILSPSQKFRIHYATSGIHQVNLEDNNKNNIPDYVEKAAEYFDYSHDVIMNKLGFQPPAPDSNGAGKEFDVYLVALNRTYGITWLESGVPGNPGAYSCYIEVDNDFAGFYTKPLEALQVTAAHEYFHAVQVGYRYRDEDVFFMEMCSTWMEDYVYPAVNDYLLYLTHFMANSNYPFYYTNGSWFEYGSCLWIHMTVKKYGADIIRQVWELIPKQTALTAIQDLLLQYSTTFNDELASFGLWNYFTGSRADTLNFYPEGHLYPEIQFAREYVLQEQALNLAERMRKLSSTHFGVTNSDDQKEIGLVVTNFDTPSKNYLASEQADLTINLVYLKASGSSDEKDFFRKNNLVKLYDGMGVNMEIPDSLKSSFVARAVIFDDRKYNIVQFFPPPSTSKDDVSIYNIYPNPFIPGQQDSLTVKYIVSEPMSGEIVLLTENGQVIKQERFQSPLYKFSWDGRNKNGDFVSSGVYIILLRAGNSVAMEKVAIIRK